MLACLAISTIGIPIVAWSEEPRRDFQTWATVQARFDLDAVAPGLSTTFEGTVRRGSPSSVDATDGRTVDEPFTALFLRPSLGYDLKPWLNGALGYAWTPVYYDAHGDEEDIQEHRVWEQLTLSAPVYGFGLAGRTRLEERMRTEGKGHGDTELRLRHRVRISHALAPHLPWELIASTELFFFLNETQFESEPGFSENRAFIGLGYRVGALAVELGYLNQFVDGRGSTDRSNHVLSTSVSFRFGRRAARESERAVRPARAISRGFTVSNPETGAP